jgi:hypothetical protein
VRHDFWSETAIMKPKKIMALATICMLVVARALVRAR